jgi:hypothetical protein
VLLDFIFGNLTTSGVAVSSFFVVVLVFLGLLLIIVCINLDDADNRGPFHDP